VPTGTPDGGGDGRTPLVEPSVLAAPQPPTGTAIKDPATRTSLNRYRARSWLWLLAAAALLIPSIIVVSNQNAGADYLLAHGARTPGTVVQRGYTGRHDWILVQYRTGNVVHDGRINVGNKDDYYNGEDETVIYDPSHPDHIRTPTNKNLPASTTRPLIFGFIFGAFALIGGIGVYRRGLRWRSVLAERDWELVHARCIVAPGRRQPATFELKLVAAPETAPFRVQIGGLPGRVKKLVNRNNLWLAGGTASGVVLAIPETRELFSATLKPENDHPLLRRFFLRNQWLFRPIGRKGEKS
jgi:hypothetical protein